MPVELEWGWVDTYDASLYNSLGSDKLVMGSIVLDL